jgi:hypothetical protein
MKKVFAIIFFIAVAAPVFAQQVVEQAEQLQQSADSVVVAKAPLADSSLVGKTIFQLLGQKGEGSVQINQPAQMSEAYGKYVRANGERKRQGYRIRLFFDNRQTARVESEELEKAFQEQFPLIPTYRSYTNPFFKVVVGDYRTKSEAIMELNKILPFYPKAIVVKESIYFPAI